MPNSASHLHEQFNKAAVRDLIRQRRHAIPTTQQITDANALVAQWQRLSDVLEVNKIALYLSQDGELNLAPLIESLWASNKQLFLPVLRPLAPNRLWFAPYHKSSQLVKNKYNIDEPDCLPNQFIAPSKLDIIICPLVGFDQSGGRLGMGGGFYDRTLQYLLTYDTRPRFVGVAYQQQRVDKIPMERWDIRLDAVLTPENCYWSAQPNSG
ncbi:MAG: 5-formyltetrahydrofolate cyclo-ligase [Kangiellaceae bacterium]|jgi:5-formyltetrahydrofolate cyclo-ligase|nr:5-formyltetrahydrofolate cyclo-ligase [Kangiellaceae bacterium]